ncbi:MAG: hypothetical protein O3A00_16445, partial [Planctomycetota bacterium]|nr:hypothetical protein [Planctomycetota bacterium]
MAKRRRRTDEDDDYEDDFDDGYEDDEGFDDRPRRRSRSSRTSRESRSSGRGTSARRGTSAQGGRPARRGSSKRTAKKSGSGTPTWVLPAAIGAGVLLLAVVVIGVVVAMSGGDDSTNASNADANNSVAANSASTQNNTPPTTDPNAFAPAGGNNPAAQPGAGDTAIPQGRFWVVLSNFQVRDAQVFNKEISVAYRVVSGRPGPGARYKIRVQTAGSGLLQKYTDLEVGNFATPTGNANVTINGTSVIGSQVTALAIKDTGGDGEPVSATIRPGGGATSSTPPASAGQIAGGS